MGHCQNMEDQLFGYIDNELNALQKKEIKRHLEGCQECARFAEQIGLLRKSVQQLHKVNASDQLIVNLRDCIRKEQNKKSKAWTSFFVNKRWIPAAGFSAVLIIVSAFLLDNQINKSGNYSNSPKVNPEINKDAEAIVSFEETTKEKAVVAQDTVMHQKDIEDIQSRVRPVNY